MDSDCATEVCENHTVCRITGFCISNQAYTDTEFVDTATLEPSAAVTRQTVTEEEAMTYVWRILCSPESKRSLEQENARIK
eukprot:1619302-Rhodomonas_salina.1